MICGLYQLFGEYFETVDGTRLDGIGVIGAYTVGQDVRMIGNLVEHSDQFGDVIGYETTWPDILRDGAQPLGTVDQDGRGNNGEDHTRARVYERDRHLLRTACCRLKLPPSAISPYRNRRDSSLRYV